jgi:hypothetical protein
LTAIAKRDKEIDHEEELRDAFKILERNENKSETDGDSEAKEM